MKCLTPEPFIKPEIREKFKYFTEDGRILLFSAPCGFGKTTSARQLLKDISYSEILADTADFGSFKTDEKSDIYFIDDLQKLQNDNDKQALYSVIRDNPNAKFVLLTRGAVPAMLIPFKLSGLMTTIESKELFFDRGNIAEFFEKNGVNMSDSEISVIHRETMGYPLAVSVILRLVLSGETLGDKILSECKREIFTYFDEMVFHRFELPLRRFLLELAPFESFNTELAKMVSGDIRAGELLAEIQTNTRMLIYDGLDEFSFWAIFREFLLWEQSREFTSEHQAAIYSRGGLYYELHENYGKALEYYSKSGEKTKVSELLIKATNLHPGMGHYEEMENYYLSLSESQISSSPALMQGMSMLCALHTDYDESERWYRELENFAAVRERSDAAAREARSRLTWLDVSLPQRGVSGMIDTVKAAFKLLTNKEIKLPSFSVTSAMPSIMNGGKDFSDWSKLDDFLYSTIRIPVEAILGKDGVCLPDCAITESKFEKGEDVSSRMLALVSKISEVQSKGTPDIEFALVGLLVRSQIDAGKADDARQTLTSLKERFEEKEFIRFMPNIDAMLCRIALYSENSDLVDEWYHKNADLNSVNFKTMKRYQYITRAMCELSYGENDAVLLTLSPLEPFCRRCGRHIDLAHIYALSAVARYRNGDAEWKDNLKSAFDIVEEYGFIRTLSGYGAVLLPLADEYFNGKKTSKFITRLIKSMRNQAVYYPNFMKPQNSPVEKLTEAELHVLRLLCADKSNAEIGEILNIKLATVKSHVSHILQKLGAKRRSEAKTTAEKLKLI